MIKADLIAIRDLSPEDHNFIMSTWLIGLFYGKSWYSEVPKAVFMKNYHKVIEFILSKSKVKIACLKDTPYVILGYAVMNDSVLHWVFIKKSWRGIGLAKDLIPSSINTVTHLTKVGLSIIKKKNWTFDPFQI